MDDSSGHNSKRSDDPAEWELLSMSMAASSPAELKSALGAAEASQEPESGGGVADATMHSQYFGHAGEPAPAPREIFAQDEGKKQFDTDVTKIFQSGEADGVSSVAAVNRDTEPEVKSEIREMEQQILASDSQNILDFDNSAQASRDAEYYTTGIEVQKSEGGIIVTEITTVTAIIQSPAKDKTPTRKEWMKNRLQIVANKVNRSSTLWSIAFVAAVTGLIILGRRWYYDSFSSLELGVEPYLNEEKINEVAHEIPEVEEPSLSEIPDPPEAPSGSLFASLRDFW